MADCSGLNAINPFCQAGAAIEDVANDAVKNMAKAIADAVKAMARQKGAMSDSVKSEQVADGDVATGIPSVTEQEDRKDV